MQTHRFTNLKCPDPSFLHPASQSTPHLSVSLCSYFFLKNKRIPGFPAVLLPFLEEIAPSVPFKGFCVFFFYYPLFIYPLFVQPSGVLSLLFSWIFFLCFYNFSLSNCLEKYLWIWKFMCLTTGCLWFFLFRALCVLGSLCENLKIFLSVWVAECCVFFLVFSIVVGVKGFCDLWIVGIKGFCVFFFFAVNLVAMNFFCCELGCCD